MSNEREIDPALFEATVTAAWETWKQGSPQGNYLDMLATIDAALQVAKPMIERAVIEALAAEAENTSKVIVSEEGEPYIARGIVGLPEWLRSHLPASDTEASDADT